MRKFITPSFEGAHLGLGVLSIEEEEMLIAETPAEEVEIQAEIAEADHALEVSDALEDLAMVADSIDEASTTDVQLLETAVSVAAGPDVEVEEIVPAMESYVGRKISTEGLVETARAIWKNIQEWLKKIWTKVKNFFYKLFGQVPGLRRKIEAAKKRIDDYSGYKKEENTVTVSAGMKFMSIDGTPVKNVRAFQGGLEHWKVIADSAADVVKNAEELFNQAEKVVGDFDFEKINDSVAAVKDLETKVVSKAQAPWLNYTKPTSVEDNHDPKDFDTGYTNSLLGNLVYQSVYPTVKASDSNTLLKNLERIRRSRINSVSTLGKKDLASDVEFTTASLGELTKLLDIADKILDSVEKIKRGSAVEKAERARDKLKTACDKATNAYDKAAKNDKVNRDDLAIFKALLALNQFGTNYLAVPTTSMAQGAVSVVQATLSLVGKNLTAYKKA